MLLLLLVVDGGDYYDDADDWKDEFPGDADNNNDEDSVIPGRPRRPDDRPSRGQDGQFGLYFH